MYIFNIHANFVKLSFFILYFCLYIFNIKDSLSFMTYTINFVQCFNDVLVFYY
jgi:hypothetical protein